MLRTFPMLLSYHTYLVENREDRDHHYDAPVQQPSNKQDRVVVLQFHIYTTGKRTNEQPGLDQLYG